VVAEETGEAEGILKAFPREEETGGGPKLNTLPEGGLRQADRPFCVSIFNPCEISEENSISMTLFRGNTQRWTANTVRCPLLVFTVSHSFTLNAETRCVLL
jgi:hypothetical protein